MEKKDKSENLKNSVFKIIMAGASGSGKTSFLNGLSYPFNDSEYLQIGVSFKLVDCLINNEDSCLLQIWDLKVTSVLESLYPNFCKGAKGALLCFDITDPNSFNELNHWIQIIRKMAGFIPIILIGTKLDLNEQTVPNNEINEYVKKNQLNGIFFTTIEEKNHIEIFKHLLEGIKFPYIHQLSIPLPEYDYDFENFLELFSVCPICNRKNHFKELKQFYFSKNQDMIRLKENLLKLVKKSKNFNNRYKMSVGIPCCKCINFISDVSN